MVDPKSCQEKSYIFISLGLLGLFENEGLAIVLELGILPGFFETEFHTSDRFVGVCRLDSVPKIRPGAPAVTGTALLEYSSGGTIPPETNECGRRSMPYRENGTKT
jgi:hypothetical protein